MTYFIKRGTTLTTSAEGALDIRDHLPVGTYVVKFNPDMGFYLEEVADFSLTGKIYGSTPKQAERIMTTFQSRTASTGVLLTGEKGSGKTMLAKYLSIEGRKQSIPTIIVNQAFHGDAFNTLMQQIEQESIVIFDEFEKVYDREDQEKMLTLLDGVYQSKKLFVLTCNERHRIDNHMKNRPGRIFYSIDYRGLEQDFILEYCRDNLDNQEHVESVARIGSIFPSLNFDTLKALVEEMNRYDETPDEALQMLNAKPDSGEAATFEPTLLLNDVPVYVSDEWRGNPVQGRILMHFSAKEEQGEVLKPFLDEDDLFGMVEFGLDDLVRIDSSTGHFEFANKTGAHLLLERKQVKPVNWSAF